jgi:hypothetical protein
MSIKKLNSLAFDIQHSKTPYLSDRTKKQFSVAIQHDVLAEIQELLAETIALAVLAERERCMQKAENVYIAANQRKEVLPEYTAKWNGMMDAATVIKDNIEIGE